MKHTASPTLARAGLNVKESAKYIGISERGMYRLLEKREIRPSRIGGRVVFRLQVLDQFLISKEVD
jgi:excisionase family DNA binding protein